MPDYAFGSSEADKEWSDLWDLQQRTAKKYGYKSFHEMIRTDWFKKNRDKLIENGEI